MNKNIYDLLEVCFKFGSIISVIIVGVWKLFEWLKVKEKEKSVGATKIIELTQKDKEFERHIEDLIKSDQSQDAKIITLQTERQEIFRTMIEILKKDNK